MFFFFYYVNLNSYNIYYCVNRRFNRMYFYSQGRKVKKKKKPRLVLLSMGETEMENLPKNDLS